MQQFDINIVQCQEGKIIINVPWEDTKIGIPLNLNEPREGVIYKVVREMQREIEILQKQVLSLEEEQNHYIIYKFDKISNDEAEKRILKYLREIKKKQKDITLFEISQTLKLPADQAETIIEKLEKDGKIKWVEI